MSARLRALKRTLFASAALFAALLTFLSLQMLLGRDPAVRAPQQVAAAKQAPASEGERGSFLGSILSLAARVVTDGDEGHDGAGSGGPSLKTQTS